LIAVGLDQSVQRSSAFVCAAERLEDGITHIVYASLSFLVDIR